jgi:hypothetical protein
MAKQLVVYKEKYYFVDTETLEIREVHIDKPVCNQAEQREVLKIYIKENIK